MCIPHSSTIKTILGVSRLENLEKTKIKGSKVKELIRHLAKQTEFDEEFYTNTYQDIKTAIDSGKVGSAHEHYYTHGVLEGRLPSLKNFNPKSYLSANVDLAYSLGPNPKEADIIEHYVYFGFSEGRETSNTEAQ